MSRTGDRPAGHVAPPDPVGRYEPFAYSGGLLALSAISSSRDGQLVTGKVGRDLDLAAAQAAAKRAAENLLTVLSDAVDGDEGRVCQVLMVRGYVNATDDFALVHKVIDAASDVIVERLGEAGRHARTALGCATLPNNNAVTLDALVAVSPARHIIR